MPPVCSLVGVQEIPGDPRSAKQCATDSNWQEMILVSNLSKLTKVTNNYWAVRDNEDSCWTSLNLVELCCLGLLWPAHMAHCPRCLSESGVTSWPPVKILSSIPFWWMAMRLMGSPLGVSGSNLIFAARTQYTHGVDIGNVVCGSEGEDDDSERTIENESKRRWWGGKIKK